MSSGMARLHPFPAACGDSASYGDLPIALVYLHPLAGTTGTPTKPDRLHLRLPPVVVLLLLRPGRACLRGWCCWRFRMLVF